jgi:hypothetical protein
MAHRMVLHTLFSTTRYGSVGGFDILLMLLGALLAGCPYSDRQISLGCGSEAVAESRSHTTDQGQEWRPGHTNRHRSPR